MFRFRLFERTYSTNTAQPPSAQRDKAVDIRIFIEVMPNELMIVSLPLPDLYASIRVHFERFQTPKLPRIENLAKTEMSVPKSSFWGSSVENTRQKPVENVGRVWTFTKSSENRSRASTGA